VCRGKAAEGQRSPSRWRVIRLSSQAWFSESKNSMQTHFYQFKPLARWFYSCGMKTLKIMKNTVVAGLIVVLLNCGCLTSRTIQIAQGEHEEEVAEKPHPAMYAVVPFAVVGDVVMIPLYWIPVTMAVNVGLIEPPF
jgi:hypothetical protein